MLGERLQHRGLTDEVVLGVVEGLGRCVDHVFVGQQLAESRVGPELAKFLHRIGANRNQALAVCLGFGACGVGLWGLGFRLLAREWDCDKQGKASGENGS